MKKKLVSALAASVLAATSMIGLVTCNPVLAVEDGSSGSGSTTVYGTVPSTYRVVIPASIQAGAGNATVEFQEANISPDASIYVYCTNLNDSGALTMTRSDGEVVYARITNLETNAQVNDGNEPIATLSYEDVMSDNLSKQFNISMSAGSAGDYTGVMEYSFKCGD